MSLLITCCTKRYLAPYLLLCLMPLSPTAILTYTLISCISLMRLITCAQYARGLCICVRLYVCVWTKNTPVCVLALETLHENTLCSFFTEFIVLRRPFLCWQALLERLIHGFLKLRVLVRALCGIVGVSPNLLSMLMSSLSLTCTVRQSSYSYGMMISLS